jgi:hypothetical protein
MNGAFWPDYRACSAVSAANVDTVRGLRQSVQREPAACRQRVRLPDLGFTLRILDQIDRRDPMGAARFIDLVGQAQQGSCPDRQAQFFENFALGGRGHGFIQVDLAARQTPMPRFRFAPSLDQQQLAVTHNGRAASDPWFSLNHAFPMWKGRRIAPPPPVLTSCRRTRPPSAPSAGCAFRCAF